MKLPPPFTALAAVTTYALQQMTLPAPRAFSTWLRLAASAAPCRDAPVCRCAHETTAPSPSPSPARA